MFAWLLQILNFFIDNCNWFLSVHFQFVKVILPLGISFYTSQQIEALRLFCLHAFRYLFSTTGCRPHIVHFKEMMPKFGSHKEARWEGLFIFICCLFKKIIIADKLFVFVQQWYGHVDQIGFLSTWLLNLSHMFQIYFDLFFARLT